MPAFFDVQCKCGKRFGWHGRFADRPKCPRCGHRPPQAELEETDRKMDADAELFATSPLRATADQLRRQRIAAGLTLHQAAKLLNLTAVELSGYEMARQQVDEPLAAKMAEVYGTDPEAA